MVIRKADPNLNEVALIFDDGPNPKVTPKLLKVLKQANTVANFFLIGARAEEYPETVQQIVKHGHEIGNHTYTHKSLTQILEAKGKQAVKEEIEKGASAIKSVVGLEDSELRFLRPPYLDWSRELSQIALPLYGNGIIMTKLVIEDYEWGNDHTWKSQDNVAIHEQSKRIIKAWQRETRRGTILAFHDSSEYDSAGNKHYETWMDRALPTLEALPEIIKYLKSRGFAIKKLSEMKLVGEVEGA